MRIAATSDIHGCLSGIEQVVKDRGVELLCIAGDIHPCEIGVNADEWFRRKFFRMVKKLPCEVVAIPGNHDFWIHDMLSLGRLDLFSPENFHLLCNSEISINGFRIYGTPNVPYISGHWCWEGDDIGGELEDVFSKIPEGLDMLLTHSPMRFLDTDYSLQNDPYKTRPFGSVSLLRALQALEHLPKVHFCGHIHSGSHKGYAFSNEVCSHSMQTFNVSRVDERYLVRYPLHVVDLFDNGVVT